MIRKKWHTDAGAARTYFQVSDYHVPTTGEWFGHDAARLGLTGDARREDFDKLLDNINPLTGGNLTTFTRDGRRVALELNFNAVKDASIAWALGGNRNQGDPLVKRCHQEAVKYTLGMLEADMQARVRDDGKGDSTQNRTTGSMIAWTTTHGETRINGDDYTPDMDLHDHVLIMNATYDPAAKKWKAIEAGEIIKKLPLYEAVYHNRMAYLLRTAGGYATERRGKAYRLAGISDELRDKFSRRSSTINRLRQQIEDENGMAMSAEAAGELGAKTRLGKTKLAAADLHSGWLAKLTRKERHDLAALKGRETAECGIATAVAYAIEHVFHRNSVVPEAELYETAMRRGIGWVDSLDAVKAECRRQGVWVKGGEATTRQVKAEEDCIIDICRQGRGSMAPLAPQASIATLPALAPGVKPSADQLAVCQHLWRSTDRIIAIEGDAGTGKTQTMQLSIPGVKRPGVFLAPSGSASRGTLREKGFANADTIAMFKSNPELREQARGGYVYIDEAPMAALSDIAWVMDWAVKNQARVILQGDRKQHQSPQRGNLFEILELAGVPICRLTENHRQLHDGYKRAVDRVAHGDIAGGHRLIEELGWVQHVEPAGLEKAVAAECWTYLDKGESFVVVGITHRQNDAITQELRALLRAEDRIGAAETVIETLLPLQWTPAQKGDLAAYEGNEVIQFIRPAGPFKAGQRVTVEELRASPRPVNAENYAVYARAAIGVSEGDVLRATAGGRTVDGKRIEGGDKFVFAGFTAGGNLSLRRGKSTYVVSPEFKHLAHGLVDTSFKAQSETKARTVGVFTDVNAPGINAASYYVTLSRGRLSAKLFSTLSVEELRERIERRESRKTASELMGTSAAEAKHKEARCRERAKEFVARLAKEYSRLRQRVKETMQREVARSKEIYREGFAR